MREVERGPGLTGALRDLKTVKRALDLKHRNFSTFRSLDAM